MSASTCVTSGMLWGMEARLVRVEVSLSAGLPGINIVGRPDSSVLESRTRVRCALRAAGFKIPRETVTVNLAPSEFNKTGTAFDLPIALGILIASGQVPSQDILQALVIGELSLEGDVQAVRGLLAYEKLALNCGLTLISPEGLVAQVGLGRFVNHLREFHKNILSVGCPSYTPSVLKKSNPIRDLCEVSGQHEAKRAISIAAAGRLGICMIGPPGVGKTLIASRVPTIMPLLDKDEAHEVSLIRSLVGLDYSFDVERPFRAPHHSSSQVGLLGGGKPIHPGEITLAHRGVLFLDELAEFGTAVLQNLRQPLEEKFVRITRAEGTYEYPCDFMFVAASNPCPCGHLGDENGECRCSEAQISRYRARLSGPLFDRIDMVVYLVRPSAQDLLMNTKPMSESIRMKVTHAWQIARSRDKTLESRQSQKSAHLGQAPHILNNSALDTQAYRVFESLLDAHQYSVRALYSIARVARAIADLEGIELIQSEHVYEAISFRPQSLVS